MRFLWMSNAPWAGTGYGVQSKLLLKALQRLGHAPNCFCFYGLNGGKIVYDGYECWPNSDFDSWGNDVIKIHAERSRSKAVITLMDLFVLNRDIWRDLGFPWLAWTPIDSVGIGSKTLEMLQVCPYPIAMSNFGAQQMMDHEIEPFATVWHTVDCNVFKPGDKAEARDLLGLDQDAIVVGMVMANKGDRKQFPLQFTAVKRWADENPDRKIVVYVHTEPTSAMMGWDIRDLAKTTGLSGSVYCTNQYDVSVVPAPAEFMAKIYNAFDVLMNCSAGEGFGIPLIEAQACGTPVIAGNYTSMPELVKYGYTVEAANKGLASHYGWQFGPSLEDMVYRLECVYRFENTNDKAVAVKWVKDNFDVPVIAAQWDELLKIIEAKEREKTLAAREVLV